MKLNVCINKDFDTPTEIATLRQSIDEKCSFIEPTTVQLTAEKENLEGSLTQFTQLEAELKASKSQIASLQESNVKLSNELENLKLSRPQNEATQLENVELKKDMKMQEILCDKIKSENEELKAEKTELKVEKAELKL